MVPIIRVLAVAAGFLLGAFGQTFAQPAPVIVPTVGGEVTVLADRMDDLGRDNVVVATGNVEIFKGRARLNADRVEINRTTGDAVATGRAIFYDGEDRLTGDRIDYNIKTGTGVVHHGKATTPPYYRLSGERMDRVDESVYRVKRGIFTTCEDDTPSWSFRFEEGTADLEDYLFGTSASFWVKDIPLIPFFPFFAAAIRRERQTGFLFPTFGTSKFRGFYAEIPFFWAISDSQDLTVGFNAYELKGFGGTATYRYRLSENSGGTFSGFYVHETKVKDDDRGWGRFRHEWRGPGGLRAVADVNVVSDDHALRDYSLRLSERAQQRVDANLFVSKAFERWNVVGNVFSYQDLTTGRGTELRRLPELRVDRVRAPVPGVPGLLFDFESSGTYFQRDVGAEGGRIDLHPRLSAPVRPGDLFTVTPFVGGRVTAYQNSVVAQRLEVDGNLADVTNRDPRVRRLVEAGGDLEMPISRPYAFDRWGVDTILHRIEPRVNYTFITGSGMNHLPLFTERVDAVKEASQVTYSVTNRLFARTSSGPDSEPVRWEAVRVLLGHQIDLRSQNHTVGDVIGDLIVQAPSIFRFRAEARYRPATQDFATTTTDFSVVVPRVIASVGTRYDAVQRTNFVQGSLRTEVTNTIVARVGTNWDTRTDTFVESLFGIDLRFQCYEFSLVFIDRNREIGRARADEEVRFSLNLLGVGGPIRTGTGP
jgi:LPS-assembly protein